MEIQPSSGLFPTEHLATVYVTMEPLFCLFFYFSWIYNILDLPLLLSPYFHFSPFHRGCELLLVLLFHKPVLPIFPPTDEKAQFLWKSVCFSISSQACHLLSVTAARFCACLSTLLSAYPTAQFPEILLQLLMFLSQQQESGADP